MAGPAFCAGSSRGIGRAVALQLARDGYDIVLHCRSRIAEAEQVADEIRERWPVIEGVAIVQRIGKLYPKTPTVLIACTAAHRDTGVFEAARYGIDRLKEIVPIWKKEVSPSGEFWVEGDYTPSPGE